MTEQEQREQIKKRLTDILLRYNIYMDGVGMQGDHNHMADSLTLGVEEMLQEENAQLRGLVQGYHTLLRVIQPGWEQIMAPHWDRQKDILQEQAKPFLKEVEHPEDEV